MSAPPPHKRRKLSVSSAATTASHISEVDDPARSVTASSGQRPISPPPISRSAPLSTSLGTALDMNNVRLTNSYLSNPIKTTDNVSEAAQNSDEKTSPRILPSPVQLTQVEGLPDICNFGTVGLHDILGDPLIKECWAFNYLFDVPWMLKHFDQDVRHQIKINLVHGFWKRDDPYRAYFDQVTKQYANIKSIAAYLPEPFGTHHSKMFILFKHDETAQVVILTANMRAGDWRMAQAVWRSPTLPRFHEHATINGTPGPPGSGTRFKADLLAYLHRYESRLRPLTEELVRYDFSTVRAALVASVPGRQNVRDGDTGTFFGWPGLAKVLQQVTTKSTRPRIAVQISSVGTLGVKDTWLRETLFPALAKSQPFGPVDAHYSIVYPTADEIRRTQDGYQCGSSIHFKTETAANQKQVAYMRTMLCHWSNDGFDAVDIERDAGRSRAGPHIKTYIRFTDSTMSSIDWAMVTSANLSKQAWGDAKTADGIVRVCSYEIGVVVWPQLFSQEGDAIEMIPTFKTDVPSRNVSGKDLVGFRMPYSLPLVPYAGSEQPWCCRKSDDASDIHGRKWDGF